LQPLNLFFPGSSTAFPVQATVDVAAGMQRALKMARFKVGNN
jgi:hypothetical protein